ncbi:MAG TPA: hypothetical protein VN683_07585 [Acidothermaceae bacterium]|nr:hypothetical protein [Acidothermaceae bacterium]
MTSEADQRLRAAAFAHLDRLAERHPDGALPSSEINAFTFEGRQQRLIVQTGIWKPAGLAAALSNAQPDPLRLEERYAEFRAAG